MREKSFDVKNLMVGLWWYDDLKLWYRPEPGDLVVYMWTVHFKYTLLVLTHLSWHIIKIILHKDMHSVWLLRLSSSSLLKSVCTALLLAFQWWKNPVIVLSVFTVGVLCAWVHMHGNIRKPVCSAGKSSCVSADAGGQFTRLVSTGSPQLNQSSDCFLPGMDSCCPFTVFTLTQLLDRGAIKICKIEMVKIYMNCILIYISTDIF